MIYNQTRMNGVPMPLLMGCTKPSAIETVEHETKVMYDPVSQTVLMECGTIGTRSLRWRTTAIKLSSGQKSSKSDQKNEIDDQKSK